jgi:hypothetical protein
MTRIVRSARLTACLGTTLLAIACTQSAPVSTADGTWSGQDKADPYNFNNPLNWTPRGVPTGTATIPSTEQTGIFVTQPGTAVGAVKQTGNLSLVVLPNMSLSALAGGFTICCGQARLTLDGEITGNVTIGSQGSTPSNQLSGIGTIKGSVSQFSGGLGASRGVQGEKVLKIVGDLRLLTPTAALTSDVWPDGGTRVEVSGAASLSDSTLFIAIDDQAKGPIAPYKVLTASRIDGRFKIVYVYPSGTAELAYHTTDVTVTVRK